MTDKLYSRNRLRIPNFKKINPLKFILVSITIIIFFSMSLFIKYAYPIFKSSCETIAGSQGNKIINSEIRKIMKNYTYDNLINIDKDLEGNITFIGTNTFKINEIISEIVENIQKEFDNLPTINVPINLGSVSGISMLKNLEPKFNIELESAGNILAIPRAEFKAVGINQTHHRIYLEINVSIGILAPFGTFRKKIDTEILLIEGIIIGNVPDTYYNLNGIDDESDSLNLIK